MAWVSRLCGATARACAPAHFSTASVSALVGVHWNSHTSISRRDARSAGRRPAEPVPAAAICSTAGVAWPSGSDGAAFASDSAPAPHVLVAVAGFTDFADLHFDSSTARALVFAGAGHSQAPGGGQAGVGARACRDCRRASPYGRLGQAGLATGLRRGRVRNPSIATTGLTAGVRQRRDRRALLRPGRAAGRGFGRRPAYHQTGLEPRVWGGARAEGWLNFLPRPVGRHDNQWWRTARPSVGWRLGL